MLRHLQSSLGVQKTNMIFSCPPIAPTLPAPVGGVGPLPVGSIILYAGDSSTLPADFLECDGSEISAATYPDLFTVLGNTYGTPSNPSNFLLPNLTPLQIIGVPGGALLWLIKKNSNLTNPPIATIVLYPVAASGAPTGYIPADGSEYPVSQYPSLYAVIDKDFGSSSPSSFVVPNASLLGLLAPGSWLIRAI